MHETGEGSAAVQTRFPDPAIFAVVRGAAPMFEDQGGTSASQNAVRLWAAAGEAGCDRVGWGRPGSAWPASRRGRPDISGRPLFLCRRYGYLAPSLPRGTGTAGAFQLDAGNVPPAVLRLEGQRPIGATEPDLDGSRLVFNVFVPARNRSVSGTSF